MKQRHHLIQRRWLEDHGAEDQMLQAAATRREEIFMLLLMAEIPRLTTRDV